MQMRDGIFWIVMSFLLILVSIFPILAVWASKLIGIQSPSNCVFFLIIFFLGCHQFYLTIRISKLDMKNSKLTQHVAIQKTLEEQGARQEELLQTMVEYMKENARMAKKSKGLFRDK